ncbi:MAG: hypothetical protein AAF267_23465 [Deinococcota bacterium]
MARAQGERLEPPQLEEVFWQSARDGQVTVLTAHEADRRYLLEVFEIIAEAREDLRRWQLELPASQLVIHPDLSSYQVVTQQPWYVAATANRTESRIDMQRARVLVERGSLRLTLRHELFHLAQPEGLPRYVAEGLAMHFAGEHPQAPAWMGPLPQLERVLASPRDQQELTQAMARANAEVALALQRMPVSCLLFTDESCPQ